MANPGQRSARPARISLKRLKNPSRRQLDALAQQRARLARYRFFRARLSAKRGVFPPGSFRFNNGVEIFVFAR